MSKTLAWACSLALCGCLTGGGNGDGKSCNDSCDQITELCSDIARQECLDQCKEATAGKTPASVSQAHGCVEDSMTCDEAFDCQQGLEDAPDPPPSGGNGGGGNPPMLSGNSGRAVDAICDKAISCGAPSGQRAECEEAVGQGVATLQLIVDVSRFASCVTSIPCDRLENNPEQAIRSCLDIDFDSIACDGDLLNVCDNSGRCGRVDCREVCRELADGASFHHCGMGGEGHDVCFCER